MLGEELSKDPDVIEGPLGIGNTHNSVEQVRFPAFPGMIVSCVRTSGEEMVRLRGFVDSGGGVGMYDIPLPA